jgi:hypothetical protein
VSRANTVAPQPLAHPRTHLLSVSSKGELAVLTGAIYIDHRSIGAHWPECRLTEPHAPG